MMTQISEAEAVVMDVLWRSHPLGADEVVAALAARDWAEPTIKTLLNRLLTKGAIAAERDGRRYTLQLPGQPVLGPGNGSAHHHLCQRALALMPHD